MSMLLLKRKSILLLICLCTLLITGAGRQGRKWVTRAGGLIQYNRGNVEITAGTLTSSGAQSSTSVTATTGNVTATLGDVVASAGDVQAVLGDIVASSGDIVIPSGNIVAPDQIWSTKTITKTVSIVVAASVDDFQFDDSQINVNEQSIDLGALVPAYGELVSAQVRCIEAYASSGADPDNITSLDIGVSSGAGDVLATDTADDLNDIITTAAAGSPILAATAAAKNIWINLVPEDNFDTITAGRWAVIITYIDHGAAYTQAAP